MGLRRGRNKITRRACCISHSVVLNHSFGSEAQAWPVWLRVALLVAESDGRDAVAGLVSRIPTARADLSLRVHRLLARLAEPELREAVAFVVASLSPVFPGPACLCRALARHRVAARAYCIAAPLSDGLGGRFAEADGRDAHAGLVLRRPAARAFFAGCELGLLARLAEPKLREAVTRVVGGGVESLTRPAARVTLAREGVTAGADALADGAGRERRRCPCGGQNRCGGDEEDGGDGDHVVGDGRDGGRRRQAGGGGCLRYACFHLASFSMSLSAVRLAFCGWCLLALSSASAALTQLLVDLQRYCRALL